MNGGRTGTYEELLDRQDWAAMVKRVKLFAFVAAGSRSMADAEDLAQEMVARIYTDAGVRWDPAVEPDLYRYMTGLVRGELSNQRRKKREVPAGDETLEAHGDGGEGSPELLLERRETAHLVFEAFRERTAHDPLGAALVELYIQGTDGAAEQAARSGHPIQDIRRARRRVSDHAAAIRRALGTDSEVT